MLVAVRGCQDRFVGGQLVYTAQCELGLEEYLVDLPGIVLS